MVKDGTEGEAELGEGLGSATLVITSDKRVSTTGRISSWSVGVGVGVDGGLGTGAGGEVVTDGTGEGGELGSAASSVT